MSHIASHARLIPTISLLSLSLLVVSCSTTPNPSEISSSIQAPEASSESLIEALAVPTNGQEYLLRNQCSGKMLDVATFEQANGGVVQQWTETANDNQRWTLQPTDNGFYRLVVKHSGKSLFVSGSSTANNTRLEQWDYFGGNAQQWKFTSVGNDYYKISPRHAPDKMLDIVQGSLSNGARAIIYTDNGGCNQRWRLEPTAIPYVPRIIIKNASDPTGAPATRIESGVRYFTGNWESFDKSNPAIMIATSEPVVIENSNLRGNTVLLRWSAFFSNVTVRNTNFYGVNPNEDEKHKEYAVKLGEPTNFVFENNYIENIGGILVDNYKGNSTTRLSVRYNKVKNIDGRVSNGTGADGPAGYRTDPDLITKDPAGGWITTQFFQLKNTPSRPNIEVAWNQVINEPNNSRVEDNINIYASSGTAASPILIHNNYIQGAYPVNPGTNTQYHGGGIILGDAKVTDPLKNGYTRAYNNQIVSTTNHGMAIAGGTYIELYGNRVVSSGRLPDNTRIATQNVGIYVWDMSEAGSLTPPTFVDNSLYDNFSGWTKVSTTGTTSNNPYWLPHCGYNNTTCVNNVNLGTMTLDSEQAEFVTWQQKLVAADVTVGVR